MLREHALNYSNRGHFLEEEEVFSMKGGSDRFMSLFCYDDSVKKYVEEKRKIAGYDGLIYLSKEHILDVDGEDFKDAKDKLEDLIALLDDLSVPYKIFFSGRGFHVSIDPAAFMWEPHKNLHVYVKDALQAKGIFKFADSSVTDKTRIIRMNNTINSKSKLYKVELDSLLKHKSLEDLNIIDVKLHAAKMKKPEEPYGFFKGIEPVFNALPPKTKKIAIKKPVNKVIGRQADPVNYPCIQDMLQWKGTGKRHALALRLASWFRWRYPEPVVNLIMEDWRVKVDTEKSPFTKKDLKSCIESAYSGHGGSGSNYGCNDTIREEFCKESCRLYAAKKNSNMVSFEDMEQSAINFYASGIKPLQLGDLYNKKFPIYPGELVIIQAPPKSMKTMLVHNWVNSFKKPTYFLEMEMSPRQMYIRHRQIRDRMSYDEVEEALIAGIGSEKDEWLMIDYKPCHPFELEKRLSVMHFKPEVVVVDHIGLMESNNKDMNGKMEEIMASLKDLAIRNNIVVFAISEMTKESMNTRNGVPAIAAARGSARIGYTANKILAIKPFKTAGVVTALKLECIANREREGLSVMLKPKDCIIELEQKKLTEGNKVDGWLKNAEKVVL
jgi:hypothetical protein